jgi:hypothetical protein
MRALDLVCTNRPTFLLLIVLLFCAQLLSAQALPRQKRIGRQYPIAPLSSGREKVPDPPLLASFALPQRSEHTWESDPKITSFTAHPSSNRQAVNFNLLLPPSSGNPPSWTRDAIGERTVANRAIPDRDDIPSAFASTYPTTDQGTANPFIDPQYYARRIPCVGPIVDRVLKQSEAHPRLTRVLMSIQPQF